MAKKRTTSKSKPTTAKKKLSLKPSKQNKIIFGSLLIVLSIALFFSFMSFYFTWQEDQSMLSEFANRNAEASNLLNKFGASVSHFFMYQGFGLASFAFPLLLAVTGLYLFLGLEAKGLIGKWVWGLTGVIWMSVALGFFAADFPLLGGLIGFEMNDFLQDYTGKIGVFLILLFVLMVILVRLFNFTPEGFANFFRSQKEKIKSDFKGSEPIVDTDDSDESDESGIELRIDDEVPEKVDTYTHKKDIPPLQTAAGLDVNLPEEEESDIDLTVEETPVEEETEVKAAKLVKDFGEFDPKLELGNYKFPPMELLDDHGASGGITINQEELEENKNRIVSTLKNYKIGIAQIKATIGPTVTLYEIVPDAGIRISKIKNLEDDIALSLAALGIRIIAPIPGKGTVGIEVPNKKATVVSMRSVIASNKFQKAEMELPIAFGKTISNETFVVDLAKMPHLLMAGATGQGKSVGLNAVITSLLYKKHPAEVKFIFVDPKKVELTLYNKIERHFLAKLPDSDEAIITDNTKVINTLNSLCIEMDNRYELLKTAMVRNIKEYNVKFKARKLNPNDGHKFLPYIVLVIDEFADLIMTAGKEVETPIARLAQLARAIGIHLIIATQRPSVNVITGIIKANFPARIAFRVTSKIDSRTILDAQGADQLIGRGDMLYTQGNDVTRLQCAFVDTPEVGKITEYIGSQRAYPEAHLLPEYVGEDSGTSIDYDISERDDMFREAAEVIVTAQQGSASLIQRKLKLGYNRAGRIIDQLEAAGIVGPFEGSKARQVLIPDIYSLEQFLENESK
ncbi:DNA translocase FtsK [Flagellimonas taeanensis]|jgi:S-DNA-T family DNA segregation ATPase FtsK/SpoIIIE|uniref:DNA segregation ATPase FtsK/SpoIIIE, S-DNA-T family n=1 Tax=Flagellimonas taeanensis TaxID=1005926 RepID=A0A1M6ZIF5_9FLAO|nr:MULTISPECIES: DNA translocase FtsK [Allomuricauda]MDC6387030.1 DNA translocase FtsK [Muricauda sp. SK9]RIV51750.1 DNA translocase FtsK [Allomuricauda taeanensis]SFC31236.1 DNA segregation ATPase FtsK/SpoIIIE, S-DNA-T family [Allomuricauda taeanensis]SHL30220.1 DNA segregation ATPase FtsK/SpoIIIE, S-DNA-T family [Allomuricauda taeanensis]